MISRSLIRVDENITPRRLPGGGNLSTEQLKQDIEVACEEYGLNVIVAIDEISSGRLFDRTKTECVTITNAEHVTDYFVEVIEIKRQGTYAFIDFFYTGDSKNASRIAAGARGAHSTITGSIIGAIKKATVSNAAAEAEKQYYTMLGDAIESIFE